MKKENRQYRVVTFLEREGLDFLDRLVKDIYFDYGKKVPRAKLVEEIIEVFRDKGQESRKELINKMLGKGSAILTERIERRKYPRLKKDLVIGFRKLESLKEHKEVLSENISMGGLKINIPFLSEPLSINQVIELTINNPQEELISVKALGRVAWMREKENREGYEIGIMLTYIRKEDRERFSQYLGEGTEHEEGIGEGVEEGSAKSKEIKVGSDLEM